MNRNQSLVRKIAYIAAIALLLIPLSRLSEPATKSAVRDEDGKTVKIVGSAGGTLARMRTASGLAPAELGEIDPASATMKFATLGLRPVAVAWLWDKAHHYKKIKDWDKLEATVEQIIRLQPNDLEVWDFQAHNLSYNVSVEFDDYHYRYAWVKNGIGFLVQGTEYNRDEPGLLNQIGWFTGQKIGRSDEAKQFRREFRHDTEFHKEFIAAGIDPYVPEALAPNPTPKNPKDLSPKPDNWLVAKLWYDRSVDSALNSGRAIRGKTPLLFYSGAPMSLINGSAAIEKDGYFGEMAKIKWESAAEMWYGGDRDSSQLRGKFVFGNRPVPTSAGFDIRLNDYEEVQQQIKDMEAELDKLAPGIREKLAAEKKAALPESTRKVLELAPDKLTGEQYSIKYAAEQQIAVRHDEVARTVTGPDRIRALQLADQLEGEANHAKYINIYRGIVNFVYWKQRCKAEREPRMLAARTAVFEADRQLELGENFGEVRKLYENAWEAYAGIFKDYPELMDNPESEDLVESVERYRDLLSQLDKPFPVDFILNPMLDKHKRGQKLRELAKQVSDANADVPKDKQDDDKKDENKTPKPGNDQVTPEIKKPAENAKPAEDSDSKQDAEKKAAKPADDNAAEKPTEDKKPGTEKKSAEEKKPVEGKPAEAKDDK